MFVMWTIQPGTGVEPSVSNVCPKMPCGGPGALAFSETVCDAVALPRGAIATAEMTTIAAAHMTRSAETVLTYLLLAHDDPKLFNRAFTFMPLSMDPTNRVVLNFLELGAQLLSMPCSHLPLKAIFDSPYCIGKAIFNLVAGFHLLPHETYVNEGH